MRRRQAGMWLATVLILGMVPGLSYAGLEEKSDTDQDEAFLIDLADAVLIGTVMEGERPVTGTGGSPIDTLVPIRVDVPIKGAEEEMLDLRIHGGTHEEGSKTRASEEPVLNPGEVWLFFLTLLEDGTYRPVTDNWQGVTSASADPFTTTATTVCEGTVHPHFSGFVPFQATWDAPSFTYVLHKQSGQAWAAPVRSAATTWGSGGGAFTIKDGGLVNGKAEAKINGTNLVFWGTTSGLATAYTTWDSSGAIFDVDVVFNSSEEWSTNPGQNQYDVESVALHEFGHGLGLDHPDDSLQVMWACIENQQIKRNLRFGDLAGHRNLYPPNDEGYYLLSDKGEVFSLGGYGSVRHVNAPYFGSPAESGIGYPTNKAVDIEVTSTRRGYWALTSNGAVYAHGDARYKGGAQSYLCATCKAVAIEGTPSRNGYWISASDGGVFAFGDAPFKGSAVEFLGGRPAMDMAGAGDASGYWIINDKGQVYAFGVPYKGGGIPSGSQPARSTEPTTSGNGYWILGSDGGVFTFGDAPFRGSRTGATAPRELSRHPLSNAYIFVGADGGTYQFGLFWYGVGTDRTFTSIAETHRP